MISYSKYVQRPIKFIYQSDCGFQVSKMLQNFIKENNRKIYFHKQNEKNNGSALDCVEVYLDAISCTSNIMKKNKICLFLVSPYRELANLPISENAKIEFLVKLHNSISLSRQVYALSEICRIDIQMKHSAVIKKITLPATAPIHIPAKKISGAAIYIVWNEGVSFKENIVLNELLKNNANLLTNQIIEDQFLKNKYYGELNLLETKIIIQIGYQPLAIPPFRIVDALISDFVVIQVVSNKDNPVDNSINLDANCIGFFQYTLQSIDETIAKINHFQQNLLSDIDYYTQIRSIQRKNLYNKNKNDIVTLQKMIFSL